MLAAAVAEESCWRDYEFAPCAMSAVYSQRGGRRVPQSFASFEPAKLQECVRGACAMRAAAVAEVLAELAEAAVDLAAEPETELEAEANAETAVLSEDVDDATEMSVPMCAALAEVLSDTEELGTSLELALTAGQAAALVTSSEQAADETLERLEQRAWLELDAFSSALASRHISIAPHVLSLLPPPPAGTGWPSAFRLDDAAAEQRSRAASQQSLAMFNPGIGDDPEPMYPAVGESTQYPLRRRVQRLSFALWAFLSDDNAELQRALEANSAAERLKLALLRLDDLREDMGL